MNGERGWRQVLGARWTLVGLFVLVILLGLAVAREFVRTAAVRDTIAQLDAEQKRLEGEQESLLSYREYLSTEQFVESEARETFGLAKPGETQVVFPASSSPEAAARALPEVSPFHWWVWYVFDPARYEDQRRMREGR